MEKPSHISEVMFQELLDKKVAPAVVEYICMEMLSLVALVRELDGVKAQLESMKERNRERVRRQRQRKVSEAA